MSAFFRTASNTQRRIRTERSQIGWKTYLRDEGFHVDYFSSAQLSTLSGLAGTVVGILGMDIPRLNSAHAVVVDEIGVVDPATGAPHHIPLRKYLRTRVHDGVVFHDKWLGIKKS
jgi:hypothetical protein